MWVHSQMHTTARAGQTEAWSRLLGVGLLPGWLGSEHLSPSRLPQGTHCEVTESGPECGLSCIEMGCSGSKPSTNSTSDDQSPTRDEVWALWGRAACVSWLEGAENSVGGSLHSRGKKHLRAPRKGRLRISNTFLCFGRNPINSVE